MEALPSNEVLNAGPSIFHCTAEGCGYSKRDVLGMVLHMRSHFVYEAAEIALAKATFVFKDGIYQCLECNRKTNNRISFREHVRHHILEYPYKCCYCLVAVRSIPELRKHSSSAHPKTPLQLSFEQTNGRLYNIMASLNAQKQTFTFRNDKPQKMLLESVASSVEHNLNCSQSSIAISSAFSNDEHTVQLDNGNASTKGNNLPSTNLIQAASNYSHCGSLVFSDVEEASTNNASYRNAISSSSSECNKVGAHSHLVDGHDFPIAVESKTLCNGNEASDNISEYQPTFTKAITSIDQSLSVTRSHIVVHKCISNCSTCPLSEKTVLSSKENASGQIVSLSNLEFSVNSDNSVKSNIAGKSSKSGFPCGPGKFILCDGRFKCRTCMNWESSSENVFRKHVWRHLHGSSGICTNDCQHTDCPLIFGILTLLKSINPLTADSYMSASGLGFKICELNKIEEMDALRLMPSSSAENLVPLSCCGDLDLQCSGVEKTFALSTTASNLKDIDIMPSSPKEANCHPVNDSITNLHQESAEHLRISDSSLSSLRSKACNLLDFSNIVSNDSPFDKKDSFLEEDECYCVEDSVENGSTNSEISPESNGILTVRGVSAVYPKLAGDTITASSQKRKQKLLVKPDDCSSEYCKLVRNSTPLSTTCDKCSYTCNCTFQLKWHLESCHEKQATKKKEFCCTDCSFSDSSKQTLIWHMAHHIGLHTLKFFTCIYCGKQSTLLSHIKRHLHHCHSKKVRDFKTEIINVNYMDGIFKCPFCNAGFPWGNLFFKHIESQHQLLEMADYIKILYDSKVCPDVIRLPRFLFQDCLDFEMSVEEDKSEEKKVYNCSQCEFCANSSIDYANHCLNHKESDTFMKKKSNKSVTSHYKNRLTKLSSFENFSNDTKEISNLGSKRAFESKNQNNLRLKKSFCTKVADTGTSKVCKTDRINGKYIKKSDSSAGNIGIYDSSKHSYTKAKLKPDIRDSTENGLIYCSSKNWIKKYNAPMATKRSPIKVLPSHVPTLPRNLKNHTSSDFEKSLPGTFVFSEAIKCPKCFYTDRVRLNLIRHYNSHFDDSSISETNEEASNANSNGETRLTFSLWQPESSTKVCNSTPGLTGSEKHIESKKNVTSMKRGGNAHEIANAGSSEATSQKPQPVLDITEEGCSNIQKTVSNHNTISKTYKQAVNTVNTDSVSNDKSNSRKFKSRISSMPVFGQYLENHAKKTLTTVTCESCCKTFCSESERDKHAGDIHSLSYYVCRCCGIMIRGLLDVYQHFKDKHSESQILVDPWDSLTKSSKRRIQSEVLDNELPPKKVMVVDGKKQAARKSGSGDQPRNTRCGDQSISNSECSSNRSDNHSKSFYNSEAESSISCASQRSSSGKSLRSIASSQQVSKQRCRSNKKKERIVTSGSGSDISALECCSRSVIDRSQEQICCAQCRVSGSQSCSNDSVIHMCCNYCSYSTLSQRDFEYHLAIHFREELSVDPKEWNPIRQRCGFCSFQTYLNEEFEEHISTHTISKPFQCSYCAFSGFAKTSVVRHLRRQHPDLEPKFLKNQNILVKPVEFTSKIKLNPVVKLEDVLQLTSKSIKQLLSQHDVLTINVAL